MAEKKIPFYKLLIEAPKGFQHSILLKYPEEGRINTLHVQVVNSQVFGKLLSIMFKVLTSGGFLRGVVFNYKKYHTKIFRPGNQLYIRGKVERNDYGLQIVNPVTTKPSSEIVPIYKDQKIREMVEKHLTYENMKKFGIPYRIIHSILELHRYPTDEVVAYFEKHGKFPPNILYALKFVEAFYYIKNTRSNIREYPPIERLENSPDEWIASLPFQLTNDQLQAIQEIRKDFQSNIATRRIVVGDVGSGKTMVILASIVMAYPYKSILMAPTSILAEQLYEEAKKFLPPYFKIELLTSRTSKQVDLENFHLLIGTHAILYRELPTAPLVIVDEQHRFGTIHRKKLEELVSQGEKRPHYLQFSATPIPRTQAMINGAFIKTSLIEEIPFQKNIQTEILFSKDFPKLMEKIREEISKNHQIAIIYPLVQESEKINYKSLEESEEFWKNNFEGVYITHGKDKDKEKILKEFRENGNILLATTVVEVGISLPRLTTIVIVGAERLGLATLHQLRGRVGRTGLQSYCYLYTKSENSESIERLQEFAKTMNGFDIASLDLKNRKGGDIVKGIKQSGETFKWLDISSDIDIVQDVLRELEITKSEHSEI